MTARFREKFRLAAAFAPANSGAAFHNGESPLAEVTEYRHCNPSRGMRAFPGHGRCGLDSDAAIPYDAHDNLEIKQ
jgi:hypothetical protein